MASGAWKPQWPADWGRLGLGKRPLGGQKRLEIGWDFVFRSIEGSVGPCWAHVGLSWASLLEANQWYLACDPEGDLFFAGADIGIKEVMEAIMLV